MIRNERTIIDNGATPVDLKADADYFYWLTSVSSGSQLRKYDIDTTELMWAASTSANNPAAFAFVTSATGVIAYTSSANRVDFVELSTGYVTSVTGFTYSVRNDDQSQQATWLPSANMAIIAGQTSKVVKVESNQTLTNLTPAGLATQQAICVCAGPTGSDFLVGTSDGKVHQMNVAGTILRTTTLASTPNIAAPTIHVTGLSYSDDGYLAVLTSSGLLYIYDYNASTVVWTGLAQVPESTTVECTLCEAINGEAAISHNNTPSFAFQAFEKFGFKRGCPLFETLCVPFNTNQVGTLRTATKFYNWLNHSQFWQLNIYDVDDTTTGLSDTLSNDPLPEAARIILIRDEGIGRKAVEIDTTIAASETDLTIVKGRQYIELSILINDNTKWDVRDVQG